MLARNLRHCLRCPASEAQSDLQRAFKMAQIKPLAVVTTILAAFVCASYGAKPTFTAAYHYLRCEATVLVEPKSTAELAKVIQSYYTRANSGVPVTIRSSRPKFHSSARFPCPVSPAPTRPATIAERRPTTAAAAQPITVGVLNSRLDKVVAYDPKKLTLTVGAGMELSEFTAAATKVGMSVQIGSIPAYAGLTLGGVFATSAHGSGDMTINNLEDTLLSVKLVDGRGQMITMRRGDPDWPALHGGLGLLGIITEMTFQMTPPTNTELITWEKKDDKNLDKDIPKMLEVGKHVLIFWRPDARKYTAYITRKAAPSLKPNPRAQMTLLPYMGGRPNVSSVIYQMQKTLPDDVATLEVLCPASEDQNLGFHWASDGNKTLVNATGLTNKMQACECDGQCLWNNPAVTYTTTQDVEFTIDRSQLTGWIAAVKKILREDLWENGKTPYRCSSLGYLWIRFGEGDDGWMSTMGGKKAVAYVQSTWLRSRYALGYPIRYQYVLDLIEEVTLCRFNGRPHWGKNFDRTFTHPKCPIRPKYPNMGKVMGLQKKYDPKKVFETDLFTKVATGRPYVPYDGCSLKQECFCTKDSHCGRIGMRCVAAKSYPEFKVCKYVGPNVKNNTIVLDQLFEAMG